MTSSEASVFNDNSDLIFLSLPMFIVKVVMPVFSVLAVLPCVFSDASVYSDSSAMHDAICNSDRRNSASCQ